MRLIDADALKRNFESNTPLFAQDLVPGICAIIDRARTIDAVQVVRCKDCKYNLNNARLYYDSDPIMTYAWCNTEAFQENDFCSKEKRK